MTPSIESSATSCAGRATIRTRGPADDTYDFGALDQDRLFAIKKQKTGSRTTEVQILGP